MHAETCVTKHLCGAVPVPTQQLRGPVQEPLQLHEQRRRCPSAQFIALATGVDKPLRKHSLHYSRQGTTLPDM